MKVRTVIQLFLTLGMIAVVVWRMLPTLESMDIMSEMMEANQLSAMLRRAPEDVERTSGVHDPTIAGDIVVYSPNAATMSEAERRRMLATAARLRPRVRDAEPRISLPGHDVTAPAPSTDAPASALPPGLESIDVEQLIDPEVVKAVLEELGRSE